MFSENKSYDRTILLLVIAFEALLACNFYHREIAWYPPENHDQTVFITEAYKLQERIFLNGLGEIGKALWSHGHPSGIALPIEGTLLSLVFGQGRFSLLLVNFVAFAILQVFAFLHRPNRLERSRLWLLRAGTHLMSDHAMVSGRRHVRFSDGFHRLLPVRHLGVLGPLVKSVHRPSVVDRLRIHRGLALSKPFCDDGLSIGHRYRICPDLRHFRFSTTSRS
jgi:hypothetical protein